MVGGSLNWKGPFVAGKVGITDVASAAGVSISTVSIALNDVEGARINPETRDRIRRIAERMGYRPNRLARALRLQRSGIIGFISDRVVTTPWAVRMIVGVQDAFRESGQLVVLVNTEGDAALEAREIATLRQQQVDGILYASMYHRQVDPPDLLQDIPTVLLDADTTNPKFSWVVPDEGAGARTAMKELLSHGHRRIGFVTNANDIPATHLRLRGYKSALKQAGIRFDPTLVSAGQPTAEGGYRAARHLLERHDRPTGLFCFNDRMAMGSYRAAAELGMRIPVDLSVVGYDNHRDIAAGLFPGLTTVQLPHYEMGVWAARHLLDLIASKEEQPKHARLRGQLIRRESVTSPPPV
jgi:LacI family transcriptional regulator